MTLGTPEVVLAGMLVFMIGLLVGLRLRYPRRRTTLDRAADLVGELLDTADAGLGVDEYLDRQWASFSIAVTESLVLLTAQLETRTTILSTQRKMLEGWIPLKSSRPGAYDTILSLSAPRLVEFVEEDGTVTAPRRIPAGETSVSGCRAYRIVDPS